MSSALDKGAPPAAQKEERERDRTFMDFDKKKNV